MRSFSCSFFCYSSIIFIKKCVWGRLRENIQKPEKASIGCLAFKCIRESPTSKTRKSRRNCLLVTDEYLHADLMMQTGTVDYSRFLCVYLWKV